MSVHYENGYRTMVVKTVGKSKKGLTLTFYDCITTIFVRKDKLATRNLEDINIGDVLQVKGRVGNDDLALATVWPLKDFRRIFITQRA